MPESRTKNAVRNIIAGFLSQIVILLFPFIIRSVMIKVLGSQYLGLNSLFSSILQVLNLAELGFGSAVVYSMYKPIVENDTQTIRALMNLYRKIYRLIGLVILTVGFSLMPFLPKLISGTYPKDINLYYLFLLYLFNTALTYFLFAYKNSLLVAHQRGDIVSNILTFTRILQYTGQIVILIVTKNYYLFMGVNLVTTAINNIVVAVIVNKKYPQYKPMGSISEDLKNDIKKRVIGLMINKICYTSRNSLDSIFISAFLGLNLVAIYNNYYLILNALIGVMSIFGNAILAGVGNSIISETKIKNYRDMTKFNFLYMWMSGVITICLLNLFQPFMIIWMGRKYLLSFQTVILICVYFYVLKMGDVRGVYSDAKGLWWENRYRAVLESVTNIVLNYILGKLLGLPGIILATLISLFIINFIYGSQIVFKYYFTNISIADYFKNHIRYFMIFVIAAMLSYYFCNLITGIDFVTLILKGIICFIISNLVYFIFNFRTETFKQAMEIFKKVVK